MQENESDRIRKLEDRIFCLESIIDHVSEGVYLTDPGCRITVFNPAKERMEHMKASDVIGMVSWEAYPQSNREISEHRQVTDTGRPILNAYRPHAYVNGVPVYIYYSTYPVIRNGELLGVYTISRNEEIVRKLLYETIESKRNRLLSAPPEAEKAPRSPGTSFTFADFLGLSAAIRRLIREAQAIAATDSSVLIVGETGTGKEVLAQSIHNFSREKNPFVALNCAAVPEDLIESILFGSVRGAFTGAIDRQGLFAAAGEGTLFLDEINSMSTAMQSKLLRALQEKRVRPVGSLKETDIHCRLICASNEPPQTLIREKRMRQDLFYRISDFVLTIPPLRERPEDIVGTAGFFVRKYNAEFGKNIRSISPELEQILLHRPWTGNTRELEHVVRNMMLRAHELDTVLTGGDFPDYLTEDVQPTVAETPEGSQSALGETLDRVQRQLITAALRRSGGNLTQAARELGLQRQNLAQRMKRLGISAQQPEEQ